MESRQFGATPQTLTEGLNIASLRLSKLQSQLQFRLEQQPSTLPAPTSFLLATMSLSGVSRRTGSLAFLRYCLPHRS